MAVTELAFNEGKDYLNSNAFVGTSAKWALSTRMVRACLLTIAYTAGGGTLTVDDTTNLPTSGSGIVGANTYTWTGKTGTTLTGVTGGSGTSPVGALLVGTTGHQVTDTFAGGFAEMTGGGYAEITQTVPASTNGVIVFPNVIFSQVSAGGSAAVLSLVLASATSKLLQAYNLPSPGTFDMSSSGAQMTVTSPAFFLKNPGE